MDLQHQRLALCGAWALASALLLLGPAALAAPFRSILSLKGYSFAVAATGEGSIQQLSVKARRGSRALAPIQESIDGRVVGAEVADLNSDGLPDLFVYVQSAGSGSYGSVKAWTTTRAGGLLPIVVQEMTAKDTEGSMGHDQFAVVESHLVRRFPIYKRGDSNAKPTGGTRQVSYRLVHSEAMWQLKPAGSIQF
ncbi:MAG: PliI family lysozyme inhibitor of I-type lysozyme [Prochlorococcaceae cyanobacterium]